MHLRHMGKSMQFSHQKNKESRLNHANEIVCGKCWPKRKKLGTISKRARPHSSGLFFEISDKKLAIYNYLKTAVNQPFAVKWHRIVIHVYSWVFHYFFHIGISQFFRRPYNPREND